MFIGCSLESLSDNRVFHCSSVNCEWRSVGFPIIVIGCIPQRLIRPLAATCHRQSEPARAVVRAKGKEPPIALALA